MYIYIYIYTYIYIYIIYIYIKFHDALFDYQQHVYQQDVETLNRNGIVFFFLIN